MKGGICPLKAPPRMKFFGWLAIQNRILTEDNLMRRGWCIVNMCVLCRSGAELVRHLFGGCSYTNEVFCRLSAHMQSNQWLNEPVVDVTDSKLVGTTTMEQRLATLIMQYIIWRERRSRTFRDVNKEPKNC